MKLIAQRLHTDRLDHVWESCDRSVSEVSQTVRDPLEFHELFVVGEHQVTKDEVDRDCDSFAPEGPVIHVECVGERLDETELFVDFFDLVGVQFCPVDSDDHVVKRFKTNEILTNVVRSEVEIDGHFC